MSQRSGDVFMSVGANAVTFAGQPPLLSHDGVHDARRRIAGRVVHTPVVRSEELEGLAGARLWLKAENLQRGGSFKMRGALLAVERLAGAKSPGVVAQSTGNHAIAVALAAAQYGLAAVLVLPTDAAPAKVTRIRDTGAEVIQVGTTLAERIAVVEELKHTRGLDEIDPYQNPDVVAGQATATVDLLHQVDAADGRLDAVVLPVGGGSALAGACLATTGQDIDVYGAEPSAVPALTAALQAGGPVTVDARPTIADGLRPDRIGQLPYDLAHDTVAGVFTIEESAIAQALRLVLVHARLLIEPAAATAVAGALRLAADGQARDIGVLVSGGNVDTSLVASLLDHRPA
ncbi:threonine dehydratase [Streptomyces griseochromogenes]|uniref:Threonine dehydratase n=2 Tax=Streptomyces griseochromogenes TaxID=68214 RepID=A0ABS4LLQ2_9ACTN|nr:pyridoxal-phosphate dependent enzyme [Streptomyces griseochromogenes]MBP2048326.1 threonine dehydratase [Streptomyces griseochromogenes]